MAKHTRRTHVKPHCRSMPEGRGMGRVAHAQARSAEVARNYHKKDKSWWGKGIAADLIDRKSLTDRTLTKRENVRLLRDLPKNFR